MRQYVAVQTLSHVRCTAAIGPWGNALGVWNVRTADTTPE